jgi:hypothetical protein
MSHANAPAWVQALASIASLVVAYVAVYIADEQAVYARQQAAQAAAAVEIAAWQADIARRALGRQMADAENARQATLDALKLTREQLELTREANSTARQNMVSSLRPTISYSHTKRNGGDRRSGS